MKILVSDFDKTLFTDDYLQNIQKINEFVDHGNMFIIATGRNVNQLKRDIVGYNINYSYLICNDGGIILDQDDNIIYRLDIPKEEAISLYEFLKIKQNISSVFIDDGFVHETEYKTNANAVLGRFKERNQTEYIIEQIKKLYPDVYAYISLVWINIVNKEVSKGNAIKYLQETLNLNKHNIYTVGDGINDISMISMFNGYYMEEDSYEKLKQISVGSVKRVMDLVDIINKKTDN